MQAGRRPQRTTGMRDLADDAGVDASSIHIHDQTDDRTPMTCTICRSEGLLRIGGHSLAGDPRTLNRSGWRSPLILRTSSLLSPLCVIDKWYG